MNNKSPALLLCVIDSTSSVNGVRIRCLFCNESFPISFDDFNIGSFVKHLNSCHYHIGALLIDRFLKLENLLKGVSFSKDMLLNGGEKVVMQSDITKFYAKASPSYSNKKVEVDTTPIEKEKAFVAIDAERKRIFCSTLLLVLLGGSLDLRTKLKEKGMNDFLENTFLLGIPSYKTVKAYLGEFHRLIAENVKRYLAGFKQYAFCCDGWSVMKPYVSLEAYFVCVFHENKYHTLLLDCQHFEKSSSERLLEGWKVVCEKYGLNPYAMITTDGAFNNVSAFGENRIPCNAHLIDGVIKDIFSGKKGECELNQKDVKAISFFLSFSDEIIRSLKCSAGRKFAEWVKGFAELNVDFDNMIALPEVVSPTRWIGIAVHLRWHIKYCVLFYRYLIWSGDHTLEMWERYRQFLEDIPEVAFFVFMLERALNLLSYAGKPTIHLVLPIRYAMKRIVTEFQCTTVVGEAIRKVLIWELESGKLALGDKCLLLCQCATALFPEADMIVSKDVYEDCRTSICSDYERYCKDLKVDIGEAHYNNMEHVLAFVRDIDKRYLQEDYLYLFMKPKVQEYTVRGVVEITSIMRKRMTSFVFNGKGISMKQAGVTLEQLNEKLPSAASVNEDIERTQRIKNGEIVEARKGVKREHSKKTGKKCFYRNEKGQFAKKEDEKEMRSKCLKMQNTEYTLELVTCVTDIRTLSMKYKEEMDRHPYKRYMKDVKKVLYLSNALIEEKTLMEEEVRKLNCAFDKNSDKPDNVASVPDALFDFKRVYQASNREKSELHCFADYSVVQSYMESILSIPSTEASCERFFRVCSQIARKPYNTNMKQETLSDLSYVKYYSQVAMAICESRDVFEQLEMMLFVCFNYMLLLIVFLIICKNL